MSIIDNPFELTVGKDGIIEACVGQEVVDYTREEHDRIRAEFERLTSDNAKLRELVRHMWRYRDSLSYGAAISTLKRMRELGIEVTE